jgi:hypothetical protein
MKGSEEGGAEEPAFPSHRPTTFAASVRIFAIVRSSEMFPWHEKARGCGPSLRRAGLMPERTDRQGAVDS